MTPRLLIALLLFGFGGPPLFASLCGPKAKCEWLREGTVIFRGRLLYGGKLADGGCKRFARFWVSEVLFGSSELPWIVGVDVCEYGLPGSSHIVYAVVNADGSLKVPDCEWPTWMGDERASEELEFLTRVRSGEQLTSIEGLLFGFPYERISDAVVTARGPGGEYTTRSDEEGRYRFPVVAPGRYTLRVQAPNMVQTGAAEAKTPLLYSGGCAWVSLALVPVTASR